MPSACSARVLRPGRLRSAAVALVLGAGLLAGCQTVDEKPQPVRDLRGTDPRDARRDVPPPSSSSSAVSASGESDQRRRAAIRLELATGYYQQGNYQQALEELRSATSTDPTFAQAFGLYGLVYMDMKDTARAEENFQRALRLAPDDSELLNNYGWFLCQSGRPRESIAQFQAALRNPLYATPARPMHNAGICSLRAGDERGAEGWFDQAFRVDPRNPVAMYNLAEIYLKRGDIERARFHSQRLLTSYPPSAETLWLGIRVERRGGDRDSVASLSSQLRRQFPSSREANLLQRGAFGD